MENQYIVSESELIELLTAYHYANCLDADGVDNWVWYMEGKKDYLKEFEELEDADTEDLSFEDLAKRQLKNYKKI